jgi:hypothetical protein
MSHHCHTSPFISKLEEDSARAPEALGALVKADAEKWWPIIKELGIKAE